MALNGKSKNYVLKTNAREDQFFCKDPYVKFSGGLDIHPSFEFAHAVKSVSIEIKDVTNGGDTLLWAAGFFDGGQEGEPGGTTIASDVPSSGAGKPKFLPFCGAPDDTRRIRFIIKAEPLRKPGFGVDEVME